MSRKQRLPRAWGAVLGPAVVVLAAGGCFLDVAGTIEGDASLPDRVDAGDVPPEVDVEPDVADDGTPDLPDGSCVDDRNCGDTTCADGSFWCNAGRCEALPPMTCPEDGVRCTRNYCSVTSPTTSACVRQAASSWCPAGWSCDPDDGCIRPDRSCSSDGECDDGVACTEDRCVPGRGVCGNDPVDADGDGVGDQLCVGAGRLGDCDDANPEVNPNHPEVCKNLLDDDCDGVTDYEDEDCAGDLDNDLCDGAVPLILGAVGLAGVSGDLAGYGHESFSSCGGDGPDAFFRVTVDAESLLILDTAHAGLDTVLTVLAGCDADEVMCNDDRTDVPIAGSRVEHRRLPPGSYVIVVSGRTAADAAPYTLHYAVEPLPARATCTAPVDATDGGTFIGWLTDDGFDLGTCGTARATFGIQERFVAHVGAPADLWVSTAGTAFPAAVYLRAGSCTSLDERTCVTGESWVGTELWADGWTGDAWLTLDYLSPDFGSDPGQPYRIEINP